MAIQTECPGCGRQIKVKDDAAGRRIKCPDCGDAVTVPGGDARAAAPAARRKKAARKRAEEPDDEPADDEVDFGALASMASRSVSLGAGELEPCPGCGENIGNRADECPFCGEILEDLRKRDKKKKARAKRELAAQSGTPIVDDDEKGYMGYVVFALIFVVGNAILYFTTGWVIIPRK